jgi:RNA polymerase sigma-70 factor (ECF subfamily)
MSSYPTALQDKSLNTHAEDLSAVMPVRAEMTDNQLVELAIAGDQTAFEQIFDRHKRLVAVVASRYFRRPEEIEEIVQVAFAKAFREIAKFRGDHDRSLASWLVRITSNACFDTLRTLKRKPETLNCELSDRESDAILELTADSSMFAERSTLNRDLIEKLLAKLAPDDRALLHMLYTEEMTVAEIAETLGWTQANVKIRAWRARRSLRKIVSRFL